MSSSNHQSAMCPVCSATLRVIPGQVGSKLLCPSCGQYVTLANQGAPEAPLPTAQSPTPPEAPVAATALPDPPPLAAPLAEPVPESSPSQGAAIRSPGSLAYYPRLTRQCVFWGIWLGPVFGPSLLFALLALVSGKPEDAIAGFCCLPVGLAPWLLVGGWIARFATPAIMSMLIPSVCCRHCHETVHLVSRWGCSCGFVDYCDRHLYRFRCPKCGERVGYTDCPRCDSTILL